MNLNKKAGVATQLASRCEAAVNYITSQRVHDSALSDAVSKQLPRGALDHLLTPLAEANKEVTR